MDDFFSFGGGDESAESIFEPPKRQRTGRMTWREDIHVQRYNERDCAAAICGFAIPPKLGNDVAKLCTVRGIRYCPGFATELSGALPLFTRALNARSIMSNCVPDMSQPDDFPYCIWHPETAVEDTDRYPWMRYLAGRACAVAGYVGLYKELELLPEIHIAEEARESGSDGSKTIYDIIMASPVRYEAMNDYN